MRDFFLLCKSFFLFPTLFCAVERGNQAGSSSDEFDSCTRTSVPHLDCRSCKKIGLLIANIRIISGLKKKLIKQSPHFDQLSVSLTTQLKK